MVRDYFVWIVVVLAVLGILLQDAQGASLKQDILKKFGKRYAGRGKNAFRLATTPTSSPSIKPAGPSPTSSTPSLSPSSNTPTSNASFEVFQPTVAPSYSPVLPNVSNASVDAVFPSSPTNYSIGLFNWTILAENQLWLVQVAGIQSRTAATYVLSSLDSYCLMPNESTSRQLLSEVSYTSSVIIPMLTTNLSALNLLLEAREAQQYKSIQSNLDQASTSCALAISRQQHLVTVAKKVTSGNNTCVDSIHPVDYGIEQYEVSVKPNQITVAQIVLAALGGALGLILLLMHPLPNGWGSMIIFIVASSWIWAYAAYMGSWYGFNMEEASLWTTSSWWRDYYAIYLIGLGVWLIFMCFTGMTYRLMMSHPWLLGIWSGIAFGGVLGVEVNTIGVWTLGYHANLPQYFTLACCMGVGAGLFAFTFALWSFSPSLALVHITSIWVGAYLFIKMIGVLVGSYPNEFDMVPPIQWQTYVYIGSMWLMAILFFIIQIFLYGLLKPLPVALAQPPKTKKSSDNGMRKKPVKYAENKFDDERAPLLTENVGSAADDRRRRQEEEVYEFGGIRSLRAEGENKKMFV